MKKAKYVIALGAFALAVGGASCKKTATPVESVVDLILSPTEKDYRSGSAFVKVFCSGAWSLMLDYDGEWATLSKASGTGVDPAVILSFEQNPTEHERTVAVRLDAGNNHIVTRTFSQGGDPGSGGSGGDNFGGAQSPPSGWPELPAARSIAGAQFISHNVGIGSKTVRSYSMLYDTEYRMAYWVAYPLCKLYIGSSGRTDKWAYDPAISATRQPNLSGGISGYDRGHQLPSADRTANASANNQTFYYTNMTPQLGSLNQQGWARLEEWVRDKVSGSAADTLYVVTGAILQTVGGNETIRYARDKSGEEIAIPNYYYKVLLQRIGGEYTRTIGFWYEHKAASGNPTSANIRTVRQIEQLTGFDFFHEVPQPLQDQLETQSAGWGL
jgi:DNA/RNA endonuclease G (NUC1)